MSEPIAISYNLGRLGQSGDEITFAASAEECAALARFAGVLAVSKFAARITLKKLSPTRFDIHYDLAAEITQACVVTLEPLVARIGRDFSRELIFSPQLRRGVPASEVTVAPEDDDAPEEIDSLHYELGGPLLEEFVLAIDPYPRAPGVEFTPPEDGLTKPESPFAVLKRLKSGENP